MGGRPKSDAQAVEVRAAVLGHYARVAEADQAGCDPSCCAPGASAELLSIGVGYEAEDTRAVPHGANLGLGCGNPQAVADLKPGETVLDLGSGGGFDCFLAARRVGDLGHVIGVDMTPQMVSKARVNAVAGGYRTVEFRLGEIEHLPVADGTVDVIMSNCVVNLSPDKPALLAEAYRVLRPGGRLAVSDVVAFAEVPDEVRHDLDLLTGCVAGAVLVSELEVMLVEAGFEQVRVAPVEESKAFMKDWVPGVPITDYVVSATIEGVKPTGRASNSTGATGPGS